MKKATHVDRQLADRALDWLPRSERRGIIESNNFNPARVLKAALERGREKQIRSTR